ncbi:uncharacterized protein BDCG_04978 [Blastomyces dermatitidis ER-3]|uniref:Uncharacterized protein n=2 Tax=Blastomyces TaxID=229219 RepID=A0A179UYH2_BLAGS|nr:uncharacterized protein BDBG_17742 [Blastomyces gilchristii SLH14081]XP_045276698.1 uncharacterized protein BDCG_04978 [Blastomyces dermatitidis ER-3]EEQ89858.2 hypothetical protein BDCG_04978 [Blastomyces dermatitidis ER-3]EQL37889.1 hypothetical protein BDFG_00919 [Blastomyces dermatitidis ATCC 26199]OAT13134.1 hypothetical protein BDBG_17742 [Blastomyces gilchristii SLH14081]
MTRMGAFIMSRMCQTKLNSSDILGLPSAVAEIHGNEFFIFERPRWRIGTPWRQRKQYQKSRTDDWNEERFRTIGPGYLRCKHDHFGVFGSLHFIDLSNWRWMRRKIGKRGTEGRPGKRRVVLLRFVLHSTGNMQEENYHTHLGITPSVEELMY